MFSMFIEFLPYIVRLDMRVIVDYSVCNSTQVKDTESYSRKSKMLRRCAQGACLGSDGRTVKFDCGGRSDVCEGRMKMLTTPFISPKPCLREMLSALKSLHVPLVLVSSIPFQYLPP